MSLSSVLLPQKRRGTNDRSITIGKSGIYIPDHLVVGWAEHGRARLTWNPLTRELLIIEDGHGYRLSREKGLSVKIHTPGVQRWLEDHQIALGIHAARRTGKRILVRVGSYDY